MGSAVGLCATHAVMQQLEHVCNFRPNFPACACSIPLPLWLQQPAPTSHTLRRTCRRSLPAFAAAGRCCSASSWYALVPSRR